MQLDDIGFKQPGIDGVDESFWTIVGVNAQHDRCLAHER